MTGRQRILATLAGEPTDRLAAMPITMMFAATQAGVPYGRYASDHRMLVEAQLLTAERFDFDHVSVISDPAREAMDLGAAACLFEDQPPAMDESQPLLADKATLVALRPLDPWQGPRMRDRLDAIARFKQRVGDDKCIEGWVEGPIAEAADLRGINTIMLDLIDDEAFVHDLLAFTLEQGVAFAKAQVEAGADIIGVGDAAASLLGPDFYRRFVWPNEKRLVDAIHAMGSRVRLHICGNTRPLLADMGRLGADLVDLDYFAPVAEARAAMAPTQVLLGNLDPVRTLRDSSPDAITAALAHCHAAAGRAYILGAGCEIPRDTPDAHVHALTGYARHAASQA